jgi:hypothetical protein
MNENKDRSAHDNNVIVIGTVEDFNFNGVVAAVSNNHSVQSEASVPSLHHAVTETKNCQLNFGAT